MLKRKRVAETNDDAPPTQRVAPPEGSAFTSPQGVSRARIVSSDSNAAKMTTTVAKSTPTTTVIRATTPTIKAPSPFPTTSTPQRHVLHEGPPEIDPKTISFNEKTDFIGQGLFGKVFRGRCNGQQVAVKVPIDQESITDEQLAEFRREVDILRTIFHPNVVLFLGACTQRGNIMIITEFMPRGSLGDLLHSDVKLTVEQSMRIAKDVALGMAWLHDISHITHRDLKPANLLLDTSMRVRITDFGFSEIRNAEWHAREAAPRGSVYWMAPELLCGKPFNQTVDVYSYALIIWEVFTRRPLYDNKYTQVKPFVMAVVRDHERPSLRDGDCVPSIAHLIRCCWAHNPLERPAFSTIANELDKAYLQHHIQLGDVVVDNLTLQFWQECAEVEVQFPDSALVDRVLQCVHENLNVMHKGVDVNELVLPTTESMVLLLTPLLCCRRVGSRAIMSLERFVSLLRSFGVFFSCEDEKRLYDCEAVSLQIMSTSSNSIQKEASDTPGKDTSTSTNEQQCAHSALQCVGMKAIHTMCEVMKSAWFHGAIEREAAERRLSNRLERTFLVRLSLTMPQYPFTLSMVRHGRIQHKRIQVTRQNGHLQYIVALSKQASMGTFASLSELVADERLDLGDACPKDEVSTPYVFM